MTYSEAKNELKQYAKEVKRVYKNDKPAQREALNDYCDMLLRHLAQPRNGYSEAKLYQYETWLTNLTCKLHP